MSTDLTSPKYQGWTVNTTFDPYTQPFTVYGPDGVTQLVVYVDQVDAWAYNMVGLGISNGVQFGACVMVLIMLLMATNHEKRTTGVFIANATALICGAFRTLLQALQTNGPFNNPYNNWMVYYGNVNQQWVNIPIVTNVFILFLEGAIMASLALQVHALFLVSSPFYRTLTMLCTGGLALTVIAFRLALTIYNNQDIVSFAANDFAWLIAAHGIILTISIGLCSLVFMGKLLWAIRNRSRMGMTQFGAMQIIFIGSTQTLILPVVFCIIQYLPIAGVIPQMTSWISTSASISLPMSYLWAKANANHVDAAARGHDQHRKLLKSPNGLGASATTGTFDSEKTLTSDSKGRCSHCNGLVKHGSLASMSTGPIGKGGYGEQINRDLEMQELTSDRELERDLALYGVKVTRKVTVRSSPNSRGSASGIF